MFRAIRFFYVYFQAYSDWKVRMKCETNHELITMQREQQHDIPATFEERELTVNANNEKQAVVYEEL